MFKLRVTLAVTLAAAAIPAFADQPGKCNALPNAAALQTLLQNAAVDATFHGPAGGLFDGSRMWGAVVNSDGSLCAFATSTADPRKVWPGSQSIAKAKAYTANAFNVDAGPGVPILSTARLYTFTQPGHSLASLGLANPFNPQFLAPPSGSGGGNGQIAGGMIFFGGGVPLYDGTGKILGALGVSGDTSCTDHEIAKRVRHLAQLDPPGGSLVDDIVYCAPDSGTACWFAHPVCINTYRNGVSIGNEALGSYPFIP